MGAFIMNFSLIGAFCVVLLLLMVGEVVSTKTKAFIPSVFVTAILFLIGFWTFLPANLMDIASISTPVVTISMCLLLTHMGTLMSVKELLGQWRTIVIAIAGLIGMCIMTLGVGSLLFGFKQMVAGTPPLTGGVVAAVIMSTAATKQGQDIIAVFVIAVYVMQGFAGYPITAFCLRKEATRLLTGFRGMDKASLQAASEMAATKESTKKKKLIPPLPEKYQTTYVILLKLGLVAWAATEVELMTHGSVSRYIVCLVFGVIACELGFLEEKALNKANAFGWLMMVLMAFIFSSLAKATPQMLVKILVPLIGIIVIGVIGLAITSMLAGKLLGYSKEMAFSVALTALFGFPADYILTHEAIKSVSNSEAENDFALGQMLPKMLVGGFTTVTIASVIIAGIFVKWL
jgi:hypothetical protein